MVAVGRPKGHGGSYMQWLEGGAAPQVVFEVLRLALETNPFKLIGPAGRPFATQGPGARARQT
jgi:hypothetical protein